MLNAMKYFINPFRMFTELFPKTEIDLKESLLITMDTFMDF